MAFQRQRRNKNNPPHHSPSRNPGPGRRPLKKRSKRNVNSIPKTKKNKNPTRKAAKKNINGISKIKKKQKQFPTPLKAEIQVQEGVP